jgi:predicted methyltransferase
MAFRRAALALALSLAPLPPLMADAAWAADAALSAAVAPAHRDAGSVARDKARHPAQSLEFWGLKPGMTVIEISPGGGYWSEILAPYAKATHGHYIAAMGNANQKLPAKFANAATYGAVGYTVFSNSSGPMTGNADLVLTARNVHNWMGQGFDAKAFRDFYAALKPGGILAVEEHRSDPRPMAAKANDGYVSTQHVIDLATAAGFRLEAHSEINANPKDSKDHPFGVWTLPPSRNSSASGQPDPKFNHAKYDAIGESDRMTLRFRKPG